MQAGPGKIGDAVAQASQDVVERQQNAAPELDDHGLLGRGQHGAAWDCWFHGGVGGASLVLYNTTLGRNFRFRDATRSFNARRWRKAATRGQAV